MQLKTTSRNGKCNEFLKGDPKQPILFTVRDSKLTFAFKTRTFGAIKTSKNQTRKLDFQQQFTAANRIKILNFNE